MKYQLGNLWCQGPKLVQPNIEQSQLDLQEHALLNLERGQHEDLIFLLLLLRRGHADVGKEKSPGGFRQRRVWRHTNLTRPRVNEIRTLIPEMKMMPSLPLGLVSYKIYILRNYDIIQKMTRTRAELPELHSKVKILPPPNPSPDRSRQL